MRATTMLAVIGCGAACVPAWAGWDEGLPERISLTGTVRDFRARTEGGHADFQRQPSSGFGLYQGMVADELDGAGKPVLASTGYKVSKQWRNGAGLPIIAPRDYIEPRPGDQSGSMSGYEGGAATDAEAFAQWFRDVAGVNVSRGLELTLEREPDSKIYTFDDKASDLYSGLGGFFPVNDDLYGNYGDTGRNYHFTFELETSFTYREGDGQVFTFIGDDDVWVFVDGRLVIDLGGVHQAERQTIELDRLPWLQDGETYPLHFFFAERHTTESNFRIETTLLLRSITLPPSAALYD